MADEPDEEAMTVLAATQRDIAAIGELDPKLATSGIAASALALARELDSAKNSATSKSMCAKALREALDRLRELAPPKKEADSLDAIQEKRANRKGGAGTKD